MEYLKKWLDFQNFERISTSVATSSRSALTCSINWHTERQCSSLSSSAPRLVFKEREKSQVPLQAYRKQLQLHADHHAYRDAECLFLMRLFKRNAKIFSHELSAKTGQNIQRQGNQTSFVIDLNHMHLIEEWSLWCCERAGKFFTPARRP